jgi:tetratricopeptide (TPR) repeat protein
LTLNLEPVMTTSKSRAKRATAVAITIAAAVTVAATPAAAQETPQAGASPSRSSSLSQLTDDGFAYFKGRDYRHAAEKFLQAYAMDQDPNLLYNLARCYESLGDTDNAIEKYELFLAKPDADPQGKARAKEALQALREAKRKASARPAPAIDRAPAPTTTSSTASAAHLEVDTSESHATSSFLRPRVIFLAAGLLVTAAGAVVYELGAADHARVTDSAGYGTSGQIDPLTEAQAHALVDSGTRKKWIGGIGVGAGAALLATSAILFMTGSSAETDGHESAGRVAFGPIQGGAAFTWGGRF